MNVRVHAHTRARACPHVREHILLCFSTIMKLAQIPLSFGDDDMAFLKDTILIHCSIGPFGRFANTIKGFVPSGDDP